MNILALIGACYLARDAYRLLNKLRPTWLADLKKLIGRQ
jgi:hypothetical protein